MQQIAMKESMRSSRSIANASLDSKRVWNMLRLSVEQRYHDLGRMLTQDLPSRILDMQPEIVKHADGTGVDYKTTTILPFPVAVIANVLCRVSGMDAGLKSDTNDQITVRWPASSSYLQVSKTSIHGL